MTERLPHLSGPDDRNEKGDVVDVLKNLRARKDIAAALLPGLYQLILDSAPYPGGPLDEESEGQLKFIREVAAMYNVSLDGDEDE